MENIDIVLVTDDREYARALGAALISMDRSMLVNAMSKNEFIEKSKESCEDMHKTYFSQSFDLILWDGKEAIHFYGGNIIFLTEKPSMAVKDINEKKFCIYKYSPAQQFISEIFDIYSELTGRNPQSYHIKDVRILVFASWSGGAGCSTVAVETARELNRFYGRKVLYLSLEEMQSSENFFGRYEGSSSLSKYLYHLLKKNGRIPFLESYIVKDEYGLETFCPSKGKNPLRQMNEKEFFTFINSVASSGGYDVIAIDIGNNLSNIDVICLDIAEKICMVTVSENNIYREEKYFRYLICSHGETVMDKIIKIANMVQRNIDEDIEKDLKNREEDDERFIPTSVYIDKSRYFVNGEGIRKVLDEGSFSKSIGLIAELMMEPCELKG